MNSRSLSSLLGVFWTLTLASTALAATPTVAPFDLRCDAAVDPLGVDSTPPRLSWKLRAESRGARQSAWQVLVASTTEMLAADLGDLWDSGRLAGDDQVGVQYRGRTLRSSQRVYWKVRVWDAGGAASKWSSPATWTMGVLTAGEWQARWITHPTQLEPGGKNEKAVSTETNRPIEMRREFAARDGLKRALLHVCGVGQHDVALNGTKVNEALFTPGWTNTAKTCLYDTLDLTTLMRAGSNRVAIIVAGGMYRVPAQNGRYAKFTSVLRPLMAIAQLRLEYADGSVEIIGTDERWRAAFGPTTYAHMFGGEDFDARLATNSTAEQAAAVTDGPGGVLRGSSHAAPPLSAHENLKPIAVRELRPGVTVYDLGQNVALMPRLRVHGPAGAEVKIIPAELLKPDGSVDRGSVGGGQAWWRYVLGGRAGGEEWFPSFFYHGSRYLQVEVKAPEDAPPPVVDSLVGVVVHTASEPAGDFACSDDLFNRVRTLIRWAQRSNLASVITDCPHRERLGWLEQYHLNGPALRYEFDLTRLYAKTFGDMADAQADDGLVPDIAPEFVVFKEGFRDSPEWGSAIILAAWQHYVWTGDDAPLRKHFDAMQRYLSYLGARSTGHIVSHGLGDWYDIGPNRPGRAQLTPIPLTATAFYFEDAKTLACIARVVGRMPEAARLEAQAAEIKAAFNRAFFNADSGRYATGSQTACALPLVMGLAEPGARRAVLNALIDDVQRRGNAVTAGDVGYRYVLRALADGGRSDVIFAMNHQSEKPGYGYQLAQGATSLTEAWSADRRSSQNHFMLGQIIEWFYGDLAGLGPDPEAPGWKRAIIHPRPGGAITWARASHESPRGKYASSWKHDAGRFVMDITVPPGGSATVFVPTRDAASVAESGVAATAAVSVTLLRSEPDAAVFRVGSGHYSFVAPTR